MGQVPVSVTPGSANQVLAVDGTTANPSIAFAAQPGLGFYRSATNTIDYMVTGTAFMRFNGNVFNVLPDGMLTSGRIGGYVDLADRGRRVGLHRRCLCVTRHACEWHVRVLQRLHDRESVRERWYRSLRQTPQRRLGL
jgi:hypothetical protein